MQEKLAEQDIADIHAAFCETVMHTVPDHKALCCKAVKLAPENIPDVYGKALGELDCRDTGRAAEPEEHEFLHHVIPAENLSFLI